MIYLGDFEKDDVVLCVFPSFAATGASVNPTVAGTVSVYKTHVGGNTISGTPTTLGVTYNPNLNSLVGIHQVNIDTSDDWYVVGKDYFVVLTAATIDSQVINGVLFQFSLENRVANVVEIESLDATDAIGDAVWDTLQADNQTPGTMGHSMKRAAGKRYG